MGVYDDLGVSRVVNGYATLTSLGGSLMPPPVTRAMMEAAAGFVNMEELRIRVCEEIAVMTRNEAAFVTTGASAGILLAAAACIAGKNPEARRRLPQTDGMRNEFVVQRCAHTEHEFSLHHAGGVIVSVGDEQSATPEDLTAAIGDNTAAVFLTPRGTGPEGMVSVGETVDIAHSKGVPVIVDAAAQLPPPENLWYFTRELGADLVIFSGGKGLCGPQASGLILGRPELIDACAYHASPHVYIGRPLKVGKEEMAGIYAAVKCYLEQDHVALMQSYEEQVQHFITELARVDRVTVERDFPSEASQPMPRAKITLDDDAGIRRDDVLAALRDGEPPIELAPAGRHGIYVNPQTLRPGEERIIASRLLRVLLSEQLAALRRDNE